MLTALFFCFSTEAMSKNVVLQTGHTIYGIVRKNKIPGDVTKNVECMIRINSIRDVTDMKPGTILTLPTETLCNNNIYESEVGVLDIGSGGIDSTYGYVEKKHIKSPNDRNEVKVICTYVFPKGESPNLNMNGFNCGFSGNNNDVSKNNIVYEESEESQNQNKKNFILVKEKTLYNNLLDWAESMGGELIWQSEFDSEIISDIDLGGDFKEALNALSSYYSEFRFVYYEKNHVLQVVDN